MRTDSSFLKGQIDLRELASNYTSLGGRASAQERYGPCPQCKGKDRFHVTIDWFFCRQCHPKRGDCIEFVQWIYAIDFQSAFKFLTNQNKMASLSLSSELPKSAYHSTALTPPIPFWQARARAFADYAQKQLWQLEGKSGLYYLKCRGFTEETIQMAGLGYNPRDISDMPKSWGIAKSDNIWLPGPSIVIPWLVDGNYWRINIRLLQPRNIGKKQYRYIGPAGWANGLYNADTLRANRPAILTEGELDALTIAQYAGDLVAAVATGTTEGSRRDKWIARLAACTLVLVAFDSEPAGDRAAQFWLNTLPNATRWRPLWKDPNAMAQAGADVRAWIEAGLSSAQVAIEREIFEL